MTDNFALAGLTLDIFGALLLVRGLARTDALALAEQSEGPDGHIPDFAVLIGRARDAADAVVGIALLIAGFTGQALGAAGASASRYEVAGAAAAVVALAFPLWLSQRNRLRTDLVAAGFARAPSPADAYAAFHERLMKGRHPGTPHPLIGRYGATCDPPGSELIAYSLLREWGETTFGRRFWKRVKQHNPAFKAPE